MVRHYSRPHLSGKVCAMNAHATPCVHSCMRYGFFMYHKNNGNNNNNKFNPMCRSEQKQSRKMRVLYDPVHCKDRKMKDIVVGICVCSVVWCATRIHTFTLAKNETTTTTTTKIKVNCNYIGTLRSQKYAKRKSEHRVNERVSEQSEATEWERRRRTENVRAQTKYT